MSSTDPVSQTDDLRATVEALAARVRALEDQVEIMQLVAQYGPAADSGAADAAAGLWTEEGTFDVVGQFQVGRVSANTWRWTRTGAGWRVAERVNANLDGTPQHRQFLAPGTQASERTQST
jgi:hypothetical protein